MKALDSHETNGLPIATTWLQVFFILPRQEVEFIFGVYWNSWNPMQVIDILIYIYIYIFFRDTVIAIFELPGFFGLRIRGVSA